MDVIFMLIVLVNRLAYNMFREIYSIYIKNKLDILKIFMTS
jgi:hypothetical protein